MIVKLLLRKQFKEIFRSYFYNPKTNKKRSVFSTALWFVFFALIMVGLLGGMFTYLAVTLAKPLGAVGVGWLYYIIMTLLAVLLGVFGSVFNTYSGLYLAKDNDLLLSMPIEPKAIITSRLLGVYLLGLMYSSVVLLPTVIVGWIYMPLTPMRIVGGVLLIVLVSLFILVLSCLLGWVVAKVSLKLKNKNIVIVFLSLAFIGAYYFLYFKATEYIRDLIANAAFFGEAVKDKARFVYWMGRVGEGHLASMVLFTAIVALMVMLMWIVLKQTFLSIATATGKTERKVYREKAVKQKSAQAALQEKEYRRFLSSANYMLNCGLSTILLPIAGVALIWKGTEFVELLETVFSGLEGGIASLLATLVCFAAAMNDMTAPSVSLEGKSLWLAKSLPVSAWDCLKAKLMLQLRLTTIPTLFCAVCAAIALSGGALDTLMVVGVPVLFTVVMAVFGLTIGTARANVRWTNEMAPVKQSLPVFLALMGSWVLSAVPVGLYLWQGVKIGFPLYLTLLLAVYALISVLLFLWLRTKGAKKFEELE